MSSDKKCCVPGCFEAGASHKVLHVFPNPNKDPDRFEAWKKAAGGKILELTNEHIYKYRRVCRAHFENKFHCRYERLSNIAIPTINMPGAQVTIPTQIISTDEMDENTPGIELPTGYVARARMGPLTSIENIAGSVPSTSKDVTQARKGPMTSVQYVADCVPSTSKDCKSLKKSIKIEAHTAEEFRLNKKLVAAKLKLNKMKNEIKKQSTAIKIAKN